MGGRPVTADEFKALQDAIGMHNGEIAEALGVSISTVVKWRGNQHQIPKPAQIAIRALAASRAAA